MRPSFQDEYTFGHVISQDDVYTVVQFEDLEHPTSFTRADIGQLEHFENEGE